MANFIKESVAELEHVVWPTHLETKKFFTIVVSILVGMTIFTYLLTLLFSNGLFEVRKLIHAPVNADISGSPVINAVDANGNPVTVQTTTQGEDATTPSTQTAAPAPEVAQ